MAPSKHWSQLDRHDTLGYVSSQFPSRPREDYWFSLGRFQITSTLVAVLLGAFGMLAWVIVPPLSGALFFTPDAVFSGQVWRLFTWPLAESLSLWSILTLVMLWYFGRDLEAAIGRNAMAKLLLGIWASMTVAGAVVGVLLPDAALAGLNLIQFAILLVWIAENPRRPFFFGIPAWVLGSVLLGIQVLQLVGFRMWGSLFVLLFGLLGAAMAARSVGLLSSATFIPGGRSGGQGGHTATSRSHHSHAQRQPSRHERRHTSDEDRMDDLLGKISANGIHSLSKGERAELEKLRERRRR